MKKEAYLRALKGQADFVKWMNKPGSVAERDKWATCTSFALVHPTHTFMCPEFNCFASMASYHNKKCDKSPDKKPNGPGAVAFIVGIQSGYKDNYNLHDAQGNKINFNLENEGDRRYLDWVLNRSPWSSAFVSKSAVWAMKKRSVIMDTTVPSNLMVGGAVAVRKLWETEKIKNIWLEYTAAGVQEDLSYFLAMSTEFSNGGKQLSWSAAESGHCNLAVQSMSKGDLLAFLQHKPYTLNSPYSGDQSYQGYSGMFCESYVRFGVKSSAQTWIYDNFPFKDGVADVAPVNINPFAKAVVQGFRSFNIEHEKGVQRWVDFQHVLFKEIGFVPKPKGVKHE